MLERVFVAKLLYTHRHQPHLCVSVMMTEGRMRV